MRITREYLNNYKQTLILEEKSRYTIDKYLRDVRTFAAFLGEEELSKENVMRYKAYLTETGYAVGSINSMLASVNSFLHYLGRDECKVRHIRTQRKIYNSNERELSKEEYIRLVKAAEDNPRLAMILKTICATGIRISELQYFTVEAAVKGEVLVSCKNKTRIILLPARLRKQLLIYARKGGIHKGIIFRTRNGRPVDRSNIWAAMKKLCLKANVLATKVFPHNLRKLFARTFYKVDKDIAKLSDLLGHSNINTTRIYLMTTSQEHQRRIDRLGLA